MVLVVKLTKERKADLRRVETAQQTILEVARKYRADGTIVQQDEQGKSYPFHHVLIGLTSFVRDAIRYGVDK